MITQLVISTHIDVSATIGGFYYQNSKTKEERDKNNEKSRCLVTLPDVQGVPYVQVVMEPGQRILNHRDNYSTSCQATQKPQTNTSASKR